MTICKNLKNSYPLCPNFPFSCFRLNSEDIWYLLSGHQSWCEPSLQICYQPVWLGRIDRWILLRPISYGTLSRYSSLFLFWQPACNHKHSKQFKTFVSINADISIMTVSYINSNKEQPLSPEIKTLPYWMCWLQFAIFNVRQTRGRFPRGTSLEETQNELLKRQKYIWTLKTKRFQHNHFQGHHHLSWWWSNVESVWLFFF